MIEKNDSACARELLQELDTLRVVFLLDYGIRTERRVLGRGLEELEARRVERNRVLIPAQIFDFHLVRCLREVLRPFARSTCRIGVHELQGLRAVRRRHEIDQSGLDCVQVGHSANFRS